MHLAVDVHVAVAEAAIVFFQLGHVVIDPARLVGAAEDAEELGHGIDLHAQAGAVDKGVADEVNAADLDDRPFRDVEHHARVARLIAFEQLDAGEQAAHVVVTPQDRLAGNLVGNRVQGRALAQAGGAFEGRGKLWSLPGQLLHLGPAAAIEPGDHRRGRPPGRVEQHAALGQPGHADGADHDRAPGGFGRPDGAPDQVHGQADEAVRVDLGLPAGVRLPRGGLLRKRAAGP